MSAVIMGSHGLEGASGQETQWHRECLWQTGIPCGASNQPQQANQSAGPTGEGLGREDSGPSWADAYGRTSLKGLECEDIHVPTKCPSEDMHAEKALDNQVGMSAPPLSTLGLAQWHQEHSGHSGRHGGRIWVQQCGLSLTKPHLCPSFLDMQPADERGQCSAPGRTPFPRSGLWEQASHLGVG